MNNLNSKWLFSFFIASLYGTAAHTVGNDTGTAVIRVETGSAGPATSFVFEGVISGSVAAGESISQSGLSAGAYTAAELGVTPGYTLVSIACDDDNSAGYVDTRTARFVIDRGETVECVFTFREQTAEEVPTTPTPPATGVPSDPEQDTVPQPEGTPESTPGVSGPEPEACNPPDLVPREGVWMVSNLPGTMVCGPMTLPLAPSQEPGTLTVQDCGWTVVGSGFSEDTADLVMKASDQSGTRYTGTVGGAQDGIPMTIDFEWRLQTDSQISGSLHSEVTQQGMTCVMTRNYEMSFTGG